LGGEQLADFVVALGRDGGLATAGVGAWLERAGLGAQLLEVVDGVDSDAEKAGDLGGRADPTFDGVKEALTKFKRVGIHSGMSKGLVVTIEATILIIGFHTDS
jgi:hypothetical protein